MKDNFFEPDNNYDDEFGDIDSGNFIKITTENDLIKTGKINKKILGKWLTIFNTKEEGIYAIEMTCKHQGANLGEGKVSNNIVTCPRHFWKYNIVTGESYTPNSPDLRRYVVKIKNGDIYISLRPSTRH
ncbi:MAG: Rieske (2Fe-2S) protein [Deltaproteobacteria bacterium]|nr:Rieske (2Fe-2S) protein [Deltaproteobacteria bacterium]